MNHIDPLFEQLKHHQVQPPESVWIRISDELGHQKKVRPLWWRVLSSEVAVLALVSIASATLGTYLYMYHTMPIWMLEHTKANHSISYTQESPSFISSNYSILESTQSNLKSSKSFLNPKHQKTYPNPNSFHSSTSNFNNLNTLVHHTTYTEPVSIAASVPESELAPKTNLSPIHSIEIAQIAYEPIEPYSTPSTNILNSAPEAKLESNMATLDFDQMYFSTMIGGNIHDVNVNGTLHNNFFSNQMTQSTKLGYQFGFGLGWQISQKWSIESGISYMQNVLNYKWKTTIQERQGVMYFDQLQIPLLARYSIYLGSKHVHVLSPKAGLLYSSVVAFQVNYDELDLQTQIIKSFQVDADKTNFNSLQLGYTMGLDHDYWFRKRVSIYQSLMFSSLNQVNNFPNVIKTSSISQHVMSYSVGVKFKF